MNQEKDELRDLLGAKLSHAELDGKGLSWEDFEHYSRKNKKRKIGIVWWLAAGSLLLLLFWSVTQIFVNQNSQSSLNPNETEVSNIQKAEIPASEQPSSPSTENRIELNTETPTTASHGAMPKPSSEKQSLPSLILDDEIMIDGGQRVIDRTQALPVPLHGSIYSLGIKCELLDPLPLGANRTLSEITLEHGPYESLFSPGLFWQAKVGMGLNVPKFSVTDYGRAFIHRDYENIRKSDERGIVGYGFQLQIGSMFKKWQISAGLGYSLSYIQGKYQYTYSEKPIIDVDGRIAGYASTTPVLVNFASTQKIAFWELPISAQYRYLSKRNRTYAVQFSLFPQFLSRVTGELPNPVLLDQKEILQNSNYKSTSSSLELGLPIYQHIGKTAGISLMPYYRRNFGLGQVLNLYKTNLNNWGVSCSFISRF